MKVAQVAVSSVAYSEIMEREDYFTGKMPIKELSKSSRDFCQKADKKRRRRSIRDSLLPN